MGLVFLHRFYVYSTTKLKKYFAFLVKKIYFKILYIYLKFKTLGITNLVTQLLMPNTTNSLPALPPNNKEQAGQDLLNTRTVWTKPVSFNLFPCHTRSCFNALQSSTTSISIFREQRAKFACLPYRRRMALELAFMLLLPEQAS